MRTPQVSAPWSKHGAAKYITLLHHEGWYVSDQAGNAIAGPYEEEHEAEEHIILLTDMSEVGFAPQSEG